ncbi:MAG: cytochrome-c oxidase [Devosia sp.]|uniref:cytochrome o ubiquinol oxidase subunit IV n=1 Tax=Devosia sp. TaxID=1871048 RepID=UPI0026303D3B|nr:cytochrome C oxidase subunit IV family protein [Devosia sp.]MDB5541105.1 cytochrome-c oxidase [Devosia sp.]
MSDPWTGASTRIHRPQPSADATRERRGYIRGFGLALLLTAGSFGLVAFAHLPVAVLLPALGILALAQIVVHFRYFLDIDLSRSKREDLQLIQFSSLLILIMVGGSLWILYDLDQRMMS